MQTVTKRELVQRVAEKTGVQQINAKEVIQCFLDEIINELATYGFVAEDLFVVTRNARPGVSRILRQAHARKRHSYFVVFIKPRGRKRWGGLTNRLPIDTVSRPRIASMEPSHQPTLI